jgi:hypothetical protein
LAAALGVFALCHNANNTVSANIGKGYQPNGAKPNTHDAPANKAMK